MLITRRRRCASVRSFTLAAILVVCALGSGRAAAQPIITEIIDLAGAGAGNFLSAPAGIAVDAAGNAYVTGESSTNAFKITPAGVITQIIDCTGDRTGDCTFFTGNILNGPRGIAVDAAGNAYVAGFASDNAFKITTAGVITEIIDAAGDGAGNILNGPRGIAVDAAGNAYVTGFFSDNAFKITPAGLITQIIDATGDGAGNSLNEPHGITVDSAGNAYVVGLSSDNAFKITPAGLITQIIDATGDGAGNGLDNPLSIALDAAGNAYVAGAGSDNAFKITPSGVITEIIDATGDGLGNGLNNPLGIAVDAAGNAYVTGIISDNAFKITPAGLITQIIDATGDGAGNGLNGAWAIAVDGAGIVYVTGHSSNNAYRITLPGSSDCNGNGILDATDIADGTSQDCNANGVPDVCEPDCNGNATADSCDIADGTSQDCNANGIPDECEPDCNGNAAPDSCDIATGTSQDCPPNGIPDECETPRGIPTSTLEAVDRGWWRGDGFHDSTNNNTFTGITLDLGGGNFNSYFIFDLGGPVLADIATLRLELHQYFSSSPSELLTIYDVSTDSATLEASGMDVDIFNDLQSGRPYATFMVTNGDEGSILEIPLNTLAVNDINASSGFFSVGVHMNGLLGQRDRGVTFSSGNEARVHHLVLGLSSNDCNANGIPDECEPDCNGNARPDDCDIADGTSQDSNADGIPDECEPDCNGNGILDATDIANGTSQDCNANGIPDECEPDCNGNNVADSCDIADGTSQDSNTDGIPDECEADCNGNGILDATDIANGTSQDCNANGIPDECEPDCNGNGTPDPCEILDGTASDCNLNGIPDQCELAGNDCNANGIPDDCDVDPLDPDGNGLVSTDCNTNGIPDDCEPDCNADGIADPCEILDGTASDCNLNSIPDQCELAGNDCNSNGIPDDCDVSATVPPTLLNAVDRGWWRNDGFHDSTNNNTYTGAFGGVTSNSYFIFDASASTPADTTTLRLEVESYQGSDASESLTVYDVSTDAAALEASGMNVNTFNDLQSGRAYATFTVRPGDVGSVLEIPLNAQAASDINASSGFFSIGVHLNSLSSPNVNQGVRFSARSESRVHQLALSLFGPDCNANGIPDECDIDPLDPDGNGLVSPDCNTNGIPDGCETCGDLDGDGDVDADDFTLFLGAFGLGVGAVGFEPCADADGDGVITLVDYQQWLQCYRTFIGSPLAPPPTPEGVGDMDGDGAVDGNDIQPFVDALLDPATAGFRARFMADANGDGVVDSADVGEFVGLLLSQ